MSTFSQDIVPLARIQAFAPEETEVNLLPEPRWLAEEMRTNARYWHEEGFLAIDQLDPRRSFLMGDFGHGSDAYIVLVFPQPVRAFRLQWREDGNRWVQFARSLDEFLDVLGFVDSLDDPIRAA